MWDKKRIAVKVTQPNFILTWFFIKSLLDHYSEYRVQYPSWLILRLYKSQGLLALLFFAKYSYLKVYQTKPILTGIQCIIIRINALYLHVHALVPICHDDYSALFVCVVIAHRLFSLSAIQTPDSSKSSWLIWVLWLIFIQTHTKYTILPWQPEKIPN